jgi:hypothetical protein
MGILAQQAAAPPPLVTQDMVDKVMAEAKAHCALTTWDKFAKSLKANRFPFLIK